MAERVDQKKCFAWTSAGSYVHCFSATKKAKDSIFSYSGNLKNHGTCMSVECIFWVITPINNNPHKVGFQNPVTIDTFLC